MKMTEYLKMTHEERITHNSKPRPIERDEEDEVTDIEAQMEDQDEWELQRDVERSWQR